MNKHPIYFYLFLCLLALTSSTFSHSTLASNTNTNAHLNENENASAQYSILLLGDSVSASYKMKKSQGWVSLLNQELEKQQAQYNITNASISGETTSGGLSRLPTLLDTNSVDHLIIELGGNDGLRGYSPKVIKNNLLQMIEIAQSKNITVSIYKIKIMPNYGPRYNKMFEQVFIDVAKEKSIESLTFFVEKVATQKHLMRKDGIHPNVAAQPIIADYVGKQLATLMMPYLSKN
jgi:acyl-CoA thioesterase-1